MQTPNPLDVAKKVGLVADPVQPTAAQKRGCLSKVSYDTEALAMEAATVRMVTGADAPLSVYPCRFCAGFHLTSNPRDNSIDVVPMEPSAKASFVLRARETSHTKGRDRSYGKRSKARRAKALRGIDHEAMIDRLPEPTIATDDEIAAFFRDAG